MRHLLRQRQPRSTASCSTCCSASTRRSATRSASRCRCPATPTRSRGDPRGPAAARRPAPSSFALEGLDPAAARGAAREWAVGRRPREAQPHGLRPGGASSPTRWRRELAEARRALGTDARRRAVRRATSLRAARRARHRRATRSRIDLERGARPRSATRSAAPRRARRPASSSPVTDGERPAHPHPSARRGLAAHVLDTALDPLARRPGRALPASSAPTRSRTRTDAARRPLPLRPHTGSRRPTPASCSPRTPRVLAFTGDAGRARSGSPPTQADALLAAAPTGNVVARAGSRDARAELVDAPRRTGGPQLDRLRRRARRRACSTPTTRVREAVGAATASRPRRAAAARRRARRLRPASRGRASADGAATLAAVHDDPHRGRPAARPTCSRGSPPTTRTVPGVRADGLPPRAGRAAQRGDHPLVEPARRRLDGVRASTRRAACRATRGDRRSPASAGCCRCSRSSATAACSRPRRSRSTARSYPVSHAWGTRADPPRRRPRRRSTAARPASPAPPAPARTASSRSCSTAPTTTSGASSSNGLRLRLLRDNASLTRQAYVEFDLEAMFDGEVYADFVVLWLLCHQSRVEGERPDAVLARALDRRGRRSRAPAPSTQLRDGVESGDRPRSAPGFLAHPANAELRERAPRAASCRRQDYYRQLLRLVYRLLFLFVAEDRDLLLDPAPPTTAARALRPLLLDRPAARARRPPPRRPRTPTCGAGLTARLRRARRRRRAARARPARPRQLPLVASGAAPTSTAPSSPTATCSTPSARSPSSRIATSRCCARSTTATSAPRSSARSTSRCSSCTPTSNADAGTFALDTAAGNERKTTGSYYTPDEPDHRACSTRRSTRCSTRRRAKPDPEAAHPRPQGLRPGLRLAATSSSPPPTASPSASPPSAPATRSRRPTPYGTALRDVIGRCIYGVDVNPMAVELCKVSLWMEAIEPGKPLVVPRPPHRPRQQPARRDAGAARRRASPTTPSSRSTATTSRSSTSLQEAQPGRRATGQTSLFARRHRVASPPARRAQADEVASLDDDARCGRRGQGEAHGASSSTRAAYRAAVLAADTWCAAFVAPKTADVAGDHPRRRSAAPSSSPSRRRSRRVARGRRRRRRRVRLLPLAPRVPRRLRGRRRRRLRRRARQPAVGAGQAAGEGVLRRPRTRDRRRRRRRAQAADRQALESTTPRCGRAFQARAAPRRRREPPPAQLRPLPALRPRRRQHLRRVRRARCATASPDRPRSASSCRPASPPTTRRSTSSPTASTTRTLVSLFDFENAGAIFPGVAPPHTSSAC